MRQVVFTRTALKALRRMPANVATTVRAKIDQYATDPASLVNNVTRLKGRTGSRLRVGDWRVIFDEHGAVLEILDVGPRGGVYDQEATLGHALLKTPGGEDLVVLPRADYDRLVADAEMLADVVAYDAATSAVADGREEFIPAALVDAVLAGENPVRAWRRYRGLTIAQLAEKAGVSAAYLSQIETGARAGTVETLGRIAIALAVNLDDLT